jgi:1-acyl-sn-glycerol-3-phosphate acyltransferase
MLRPKSLSAAGSLIYLVFKVKIMPRSYDDLPPVRNRIVYIYHIFVKALAFFLFGLGALFLIIFFFPVMRLVLHPAARFQKYARRLVSASFRFFISFMRITGIVELRVEDRQKFRLLSSKIVAANHPSLLDVVMLISLIPNADCIVRGALSHSIVGGIVRAIYILNSFDFDTLAASCAASLNQGNCLIIFPEGTRARHIGDIKFKRGAAYLSLASSRGVVPVYIGGSDKYGLGKKEPFFSFNPSGKYVYEIKMCAEISPAEYASLPRPIAARRFTGDIQSRITGAAGISH